MLGQSSIADQFDPAFFKTNFWLRRFDPRVLYKAFMALHDLRS
jgi:hypothetical protein